MVRFFLYGRADKRLLSYPLIRACCFHGRTLVVTDDGNMKNLYREDGDIGTCGYADICVNTDLMIPDSIRIKDYEYVVYVSADKRAIKHDCLMRFINNSTEFLSKDPYFEEKPLKENEYRFLVKLERGAWLFSDDSANKKDARIGTVVKWTPERHQYVCACEEAGELLPLKDKALAEIVAKIFSPMVGQKKEQVVKMLGRQNLQTTKKGL